MSTRVEITVQAQSAQLELLAAELEAIPQGLQQVQSRAVNKVATAAQTQIVRAIADEYAVTQGELRRRNVSLHRASWSDPTARIAIFGRRIPLSRWRARQTRRGVTYAIRRSGGRTVLEHAFIAAMPTGHVGVMVRRGRPRLPIDERMGPSIPAVAGNLPELAADVLDQQIADRLAGELTTQAELILQRRGRP